jgi:hypothetical protein
MASRLRPVATRRQLWMLAIASVLVAGAGLAPVPPIGASPSGTIDEAALRDGDIIFRSGYGIEAQAIRAADKERLWSHVGLLVQHTDGWAVVHAMPEAGISHAVQVDRLQDFIAPGVSKRAHVFRLRPTPSTRGVGWSSRIRASIASFEHSKARYDFDFELDDASRLYCTELIWRVYRQVGIDLLPERRRMERMGVILPGALIRAGALASVDDRAPSGSI